MTGVAYIPYLTGMFPGRANIPGYRWFDRERYQRRPLSVMRFRNYHGLGSYLMDRDLSKSATTLFELIKPSSNIFSGISRGTGIRRNAAYFRRVPATLKFFRTGDWDHIDAAGECFLQRAAMRKREKFTFHTTYSIDEYSHHHGPFSARARERYIEFDKVLGRFGETLRRTGQLETSLLMMGADHGHTEVKSHFDLEGFIERLGYKTLYYPKQMKRWLGANAAVMVAGNGVGHIYLKGPAKWAERHDAGVHLEKHPTLVDDLLANDAVDHVIYRARRRGARARAPRLGRDQAGERPRRIPRPRAAIRSATRRCPSDDDAHRAPRAHRRQRLSRRAVAGGAAVRLAARRRLRRLGDAGLRSARGEQGEARVSLVPRLAAPRAHARAVRAQRADRRSPRALGRRVPDDPRAARKRDARRNRRALAISSLRRSRLGLQQRGHHPSSLAAVRDAG